MLALNSYVKIIFSSRKSIDEDALVETWMTWDASSKIALYVRMHMVVLLCFLFRHLDTMWNSDVGFVYVAYFPLSRVISQYK